MEKLTVWNGRANPIYIQLSKMGSLLTADEMAAITKVEMKCANAFYSSEDFAECFDLTTFAAESKIMVKPGLLGLPVGQDTVEVIIYDSAKTEGIMWLQVRFVVSNEAEKVDA